jgi:hypothetical protein
VTLQNMSFNTHSLPNPFILNIILSTSSLASASSAFAASPQRLPRRSDLPPWSNSLPTGRLDRNLEEIHYSGKVVRLHDLDDGPETLDDSYDLLRTGDEVRLNSLALTVRELETLPRDNAALMTHGFRTSSEWFEPSAPTEMAPPALSAAADEADYDDSAYFLHCDWHHRQYIGIISGLVVVLMVIGAMSVLKLLWRRSRQARRRARRERLGLGLVQQEVGVEPGTTVEKVRLL